MSPSTKFRLGVIGVAAQVCAAAASAQTIDPFYAGSYTYVSLGSVPGVPLNFGGLTLSPNDPNLLIIGGAANGSAGAVYSIRVTRNSGGHINGFTGTAQFVAAAAYNDGGVCFGPGNVLFYTRYPTHELGQILPGSTVTDRVTALGPLGMAASVGSVNFAPFGYPGGAGMRLLSYNTGNWSRVNYSGPDAFGLYTIDSLVNTSIVIPGAPEGFAYVPKCSPLFGAPSIVVALYGAGEIDTYVINSSGDPDLSTRRTFMTGLGGAEGAFIDPLTGDFLFSTYGGANQVIVVQGFTAPRTCLADIVSIGGEPPSDGCVTGDDFIAFINAFASDGSLADIVAIGGAPPPDGLVTGDDFIAFINAFAGGC